MGKEELLKLYFKYRFYIFPAISALVGLTLIVLVVAPQLLSFLENIENLKKTNNRLNSLQVKAIALQSLNEADLKKGTEVVLSVLPDDKDYAKILGLVQSKTSAFGFVILSFQVGQPFTSSIGVQGYGVKLEMAGFADNFKSLLEALEDSVPVLRISSIEITNPRGSNRLEVILSVDTYYSNLPKAIGSVDAPLPQLTSEDQQLLAKYSSIQTPVSTSSAAPSPLGKSNPFE